MSQPWYDDVDVDVDVDVGSGTSVAVRRDVPRVVVFGDVIDDIVVHPHRGIRIGTHTAASIRRRPGGSAANVSAWLGSAGMEVDFVGRVGAVDRHRYERHLTDHGVRAHLIADETRPTGTIIDILNEPSGRSTLVERGANRVLTPNDVPDALLQGASALFFTGYSVFSGQHDPVGTVSDFQELLARCRLLGVSVVVDPGSVGFLEDFGTDPFLQAVRGASVMLPNLTEGRLLTGLSDPLDVAEKLAESFSVVALTLGPDGVVIATGGAPAVIVPVTRLERAGTIGVGDAFSAGFLAAWLTGEAGTSAAEFGARLAARAIAVDGGRPA
jgi:sugar/nucleoside kinase (ribokinase family)